MDYFSKSLFNIGLPRNRAELFGISDVFAEFAASLGISDQYNNDRKFMLYVWLSSVVKLESQACQELFIIFNKDWVHSFLGTRPSFHFFSHSKPAPTSLETFHGLSGAQDRSQHAYKMANKKQVKVDWSSAETPPSSSFSHCKILDYVRTGTIDLHEDSNPKKWRYSSIGSGVHSKSKLHFADYQGLKAYGRFTARRQ